MTGFRLETSAGVLFRGHKFGNRYILPRNPDRTAANSVPSVCPDRQPPVFKEVCAERRRPASGACVA